MAAGMAQVNLSGLRSINRVIESRQDANRGLASGDVFLGDRRFWLKPLGSFARQDDRGGVSGYEADTYGLVFGLDGARSEALRLGAAFSYMRSDVDNNSTVALQNAKVDGYRLTGYGSYALDPRTDVTFQADLGTSTNKGSRSINFGGIVSTATSKYRSWNAHVGAAVARSYDLSPETRFIPSVRADYTYFRDPAYTESGAGALNLSVAKSTTKELIVLAEGKVNHALSGRTNLTGNLGLGYDLLAKQSSITAAYVGGGAQFTTQGLKRARELLRAGFGVVANPSKTVQLTARYDLELRSGFRNHTFSVQVKIPL
jgi:outer membrane autotransporter protein